MKTPYALRKINPLNRKKSDPAKFVFTGKALHQETDIQLFRYNKTECTEDNVVNADHIPPLNDKEFMHWLNVYGLSDTKTIESICKRLNIHSLVIQDILDLNQRAKFQEFDGFSFLTIKSILPTEKEVISEQISFVFGPFHLVSFQEKKADYFDHLRTRLREDKGIIRERGSDYLLYAMLESILDNYFKTIDHLDNLVGGLGLHPNGADSAPHILEKIEQYKKVVHYIRKSILPIKEFSSTVEKGECSFIENRHLKYFQEIKDLCLTLIDSCDMLQTTLESNTNLFFSIQSHRMNQVMKTLTIVATIFIPLTFIAGVYGMNFYNMPELEWRYGYSVVWGIMALVFLGMVIYFRKKKWF